MTAKRAVMSRLGNLADHRLVFAIQMLLPWNWERIVEILKGVDILVSSAPPWPVHFAAKLLASRLRIPWVADYRDQFSGHHIFKGSRLSRKLERVIESDLLQTAESVSVISGPMKEFYDGFHRKVMVFENGFDLELIDRAKEHAKTIPKGPHLNIRFMGTVTPNSMPSAFLSALSKMSPETRRRLKVEFYGDVSLAKGYQATNHPELSDTVSFHPPVPYSESLALMASSAALYFKETSDATSLSSKGMLTTKLFEYVANGLPILLEVSPDTLVGDFAKRAGVAYCCSLDEDQLRTSLERLCESQPEIVPNQEFILRYTREAMAKRFEEYLDAVVSSRDPRPDLSVVR